MGREAGLRDPESEARLTLARVRLDQVPAPRDEALRLSAGQDPAFLPLAELWHAAGDDEQAARHAHAAYRQAWADGEPYVSRYDLDRATALLRQLGEDVPALPAYDPARDPEEPWEDEIAAAITGLGEKPSA